MSERTNQITVAVDVACFPLANALMIGQTQLDPAAQVYIRYKFYDKGQWQWRKIDVGGYISYCRILGQSSAKALVSVQPTKWNLELIPPMGNAKVYFHSGVIFILKQYKN